MHAAETSRQATFWRALVLVVACAVALSPALRGTFVLDDDVLVTHNLLLRGSLWRLWTSTSQQDWMPITSSAFWIEWRAFGMWPTGYHVVSVALHVAVALLVWRLLARLEIPGAFLGALLFALHPVAAGTAAWIAEQKNTICAVFFVGSLIAWTEYVRSPSRRWLLLALLAHAAALLSKGAAVPAPVAMLAIALWWRRRLDRGVLIALIPFAIASAAGAAMTVWIQSSRAMAGADLPARGLTERIGGAGWVFGFYLVKAFVPVRLGFVYPGWPVGPHSPLFWLPLAGFGALVGGLVWKRRTPVGRALLLALGYHAVLVLPVAGLVDMAWHVIAPVADHLQYLALIGPAALAGAGLRTAQSHPRLALLARVAAVPLVIAAGAGSFARASVFESRLSLWRDAVARAPRSGFAHYQLSGAYSQAGMPVEALRHQLEGARIGWSGSTKP